MKVTLKKGFEYIPEWLDNKKEKPEDQIRVNFRFLSGADLPDCFNKDSSPNKEKEFCLIVKSIENLFDEEGNKLTAKDIYNQDGMAALVFELWGAYRQETEIDKKK